MKGTHVIQVYAIYEFPKRSAGDKDAWEIWGQLDPKRTKSHKLLVADTYWTTDPTVADTAEVSMRRKLPMTVDWFQSGMGQHVEGCELFQETSDAA